MPPGVRIRVHVPVEGNPVNITLPVDTVQLGWLMDTITGAVGVDDGAVIITLEDAIETHPAEVTVKVYMAGARPDMVVLVPVPVVVTAPGVCVNVHVPLAGKEFNTTLPPAIKHVG